MESSGWFPCLDLAISDGAIKLFKFKKLALDAGKPFGWREAIYIQRRFERGWVVGKEDFQSDLEGDIEFRVIKLPLLRWDIVNGIKICPVLKIRKAKETSNHD